MLRDYFENILLYKYIQGRCAPLFTYIYISAMQYKYT